jgi:hypothetical protein
MRFVRPSRLTACVGLLAMLLIYAAPLWSQAARAPMAGMHCHDGPPSPPVAAHLDDACGYCSLLASSPALGDSLPSLPGALPWLRPVILYPAPASVSLATERHGAQPRAPPRSLA